MRVDKAERLRPERVSAKVDYATRQIAWKLGGSARPESLEVIDRYRGGATP